MDSKSGELLLSFYNALTWKRIGQVAVVLLFAALGVIFWINRQYLAEYVRPSKLSADRPPLIVSDKGKTAIDETLAKSGGVINTISVVRMELERNTRSVIFFATNDPEIRRQNDNFIATHATPGIPIFTDDQVNNKRIIGYVNGEFQCVEWKDAQASRYLIGVNVKYTCATPVPPIYGQFRGIVIAFIKIVPDAEEQLRIKNLLRDLSDRLDNPSDKLQSKPSP
jgi:hypothetical protein